MELYPTIVWMEDSSQNQSFSPLLSEDSSEQNGLSHEGEGEELVKFAQVCLAWGSRQRGMGWEDRRGDSEPLDTTNTFL